MVHGTQSIVEHMELLSFHQELIPFEVYYHQTDFTYVLV